MSILKIRGLTACGDQLKTVNHIVNWRAPEKGFKHFQSARDLKKVHEQFCGNAKGISRRGITVCLFSTSRLFYVDQICSLFKQCK